MQGYDAMLMDLAKQILKELGDFGMSSSRGFQYLQGQYLHPLLPRKLPRSILLLTFSL